MKNSTILFALLSSLVATNAIAEDSGISETGIRYNHIGLEYTQFSPKDGTAMSGYTLNGRVLVHKNAYVSGNFNALSATGQKADRYGIYAGYRVGITSNADFFAEAGFLNVSFKSDEYSNSSSGYDVAAGINVALVPDLQGSVKLSYPRYSKSQFDDFSKFTYGGNLTYFLTKEIGISAAVSQNSSHTIYGAGLTYAF